MNVAERRVLENLLARLDPKHPRFRGDERVREALASIDLYMTTWVRSPLGLLLKEDRIREDLQLALDLSS